MSKQSIIRENLMVNLALLSLLWLSLLYFGTPAATIGLDASWTQSFAYAFKNGYQAGVDYIYTYGPLGYFYHSLSSYDADLFYSFMAWRIIMGLLIAAFFVAIASKIDGKIEKFLYFFLLTVVISSFPTDPLHFLVITGVVILAIKTLPSFKKNPGRSAILIGFILCFLAVLSLTKFTHFVLVSLGIFAITVMVWHLYSVLVALAIPLTFAIFIMIVWLIIGQSPSNFPDFIANSLQIASGYGEAMSILFTPTEIKFAMACFGIMTPLVLLACFIKPLKFERFVIAGFIMLGLFLAWKAGFIRQGLHERIFFAFAVIVPLFLDYNRDMNVMLLFVYKALRYLAIFTALAGLFVVVGTSLNYKPHNFIGKWNKRVVNNFHTLLHLQQHKENKDKIVLKFKQQYDLPNIRAQVGQSTVDIFSWEQGVLFLNELNWHPRPVFQSYTAYTPSLIATNGDFYASDKAPEFVIFKLQAIDRQFLLMNDAETFKILFRDYQPVLSEKGYLLLKRKPRGQGFVSEGETLLRREIKIDEPLDIRLMSHKPLLLSLDIRKSLLGHLYTLLYRLPEIYLEVVATDGTKMSYRVIPKMTTSGFVINPLIRNQAELIGWYKGIPLKRVATLRVVIKPDWLQYLFKSHIDVTVSEFDVTPYPMDVPDKVDSSTTD